MVCTPRAARATGRACPTFSSGRHQDRRVKMTRPPPPHPTGRGAERCLQRRPPLQTRVYVGMGGPARVRRSLHRASSQPLYAAFSPARVCVNPRFRCHGHPLALVLTSHDPAAAHGALRGFTLVRFSITLPIIKRQGRPEAVRRCSQRLSGTLGQQAVQRHPAPRHPHHRRRLRVRPHPQFRLRLRGRRPSEQSRQRGGRSPRIPLDVVVQLQNTEHGAILTAIG